MQIKILQWNVWYKEKIENIANTVKIINPDIFCLQELSINNKYNALVSNTPQYLEKELKYYYFHFAEAQCWPEENCIGNGIFSRFPIINKYSYHLQRSSQEASDYSDEGRVYAEVELNLPNKIITVGTVHLSYTHRFRINSSKKKEVNALIEIIKRKKQNYILTGDFNAVPNSYTVKRVKQYLKNYGPSLTQKTWTTKLFKYKGFEENETNWRLDYIFGTPEIHVSSSEIINTPYSDHLPILTTVTI